ncbi:MAG TPA: ribonuclease HII [Candidatus Saccharimonadales bacterium]|jgi:ribonuclease HII|nr:ribonuclease HII [Candidatus Saccharimonadales bacterium]
MILGIDEVGRGCWAGPLVAGAVLLKHPIRGLRDSKKLTRLQRERLDLVIRKRALAIGLGWVTPVELDAIGLTEAVRLAMRRALAEIAEPYDEIIIDGNYNFLADVACTRTLIKADDLVPAVSAASIVAKVARDAFMRSIAKEYPDYQFESHVGYGTRAHQAAIKLHGICELHRRSFQPIKLFAQA